MPFNQQVKRKIVRDADGKHRPCVMCGTDYPLPDAVHIIDEKEWKLSDCGNCDRQENGIPLCPNCHRVFDDVLRPYLYKALSGFGSTNLPGSWRKNNKITEQEPHEPVSDQDLGLGKPASGLDESTQ